MILTIAGRELRGLFQSPLAWVVLAVVQFILGWLFLTQIDAYNQIQPQLATLPTAPGITEIIVAPLFSNATFILLLVVPLVTMRLISGERRAQTLPLLLSAPVSITEIILGKYLGTLAFFAILLAMVALMPLSLLTGGALDWGLLGANLLGLGLMLAAFSAAGLYMSTLTAQPTIAAVSSFGLLLLLWVIDLAGSGGEGSALFGYLSLQRHYQSLLRGLFNSSDILYYLLFIATFLILSIRRLDGERLQP